MATAATDNAVEPAAPPETPEAPAPEVSSPEPNVEATPSAPDLTADTYTWDQWDGSSYDAFPESVRPWLEKAGGFYSSREEAIRSDVKQTQKILDTLLADLEDPRVADLTAKYNEAASWRAEKEQEWAQKEQEWKAYQTAVENSYRAYVDEIARNFEERNPWIFQDPKLQQSASDLLDEGFDLEQLPELLKLPPQTLVTARKIHQDLRGSGAKNAGPYAVRLALAETRPAEPGPSAALTAGSSATQSNAAPAAPAPDADWETLKHAASFRALRGRS